MATETVVVIREIEKIEEAFGASSPAARKAVLAQGFIWLESFAVVGGAIIPMLGDRGEGVVGFTLFYPTGETLTVKATD